AAGSRSGAGSADLTGIELSSNDTSLAGTGASGASTFLKSSAWSDPAPENNDGTANPVISGALVWVKGIEGCPDSFSKLAGVAEDSGGVSPGDSANPNSNPLGAP